MSSFAQSCFESELHCKRRCQVTELLCSEPSYEVFLAGITKVDGSLESGKVYRDHRRTHRQTSKQCMAEETLCKDSCFKAANLAQVNNECD